MGSDIDWATVARSDEPLSATDSEQSEQLLEVPELTEGSLRETERQLSAASEAEAADDEPKQHGEPGSQVDCEICGRNVRVRKDGTLSKHVCNPKAARGNRFDHLPERRNTAPRKVRDFTITIAAWAVEESSARVLARPFGVDSDDVPTELPDAEGMLGPPLDLVWPSLPDSAQKFIAACADNSDLIACALAWGDWLHTIGKWTSDMRKYQQTLVEQEKQNGPSKFAATDGIGRVVPFSPA
jgi:hypothetical protein